jgi:HEPN domain-containing protein
MNRLKFLKSLLRISKADLKASKLLYENGFFIQSCFYYQQSIEKANKAFAIFGEFLDPTHSKAAGHEHVELHKRAINKSLGKLKGPAAKSEEYIQFLDVVKQYLPINISDYKKKLNDSLHIKNELKGFSIYNISDAELGNLLEGISQVNIEFEILSTNIDSLDIAELGNVTRSKLQSLLKTLSLHEDMDFENPAFIKEFDETIKLSLRFISSLLPPYNTLNILGFFVSQLVSVRYPEITTGFDPIRAINKSHPLIKAFPKLHKITFKAINQLSAFIL